VSVSVCMRARVCECMCKQKTHHFFKYTCTQALRVCGGSGGGGGGGAKGAVGGGGGARWGGWFQKGEYLSHILKSKVNPKVSVLQSVAECCRVCQCVAVCCSES